jgi:hypothetical protein
LLSVVLGRRSKRVFEHVVESRTIVTSAHTVDEIRGVLRGRPNLPSGAAERAEALLSGIGVIEEAVYAGLLEGAAGVLTKAVASGNGSMADAHLLACAWTFDADLWSHNRDFAGTGWPSWSNANLSEAIGSPT